MEASEVKNIWVPMGEAIRVDELMVSSELCMSSTVPSSSLTAASSVSIESLLGLQSPQPTAFLPRTLTTHLSPPAETFTVAVHRPPSSAVGGAASSGPEDMTPFGNGDFDAPQTLPLLVGFVIPPADLSLRSFVAGAFGAGSVDGSGTFLRLNIARS